jgi:hypothetical protein
MLKPKPPCQVKPRIELEPVLKAINKVVESSKTQIEAKATKLEAVAT